MLKCPYCSARFPLTWKRYLTTFSGRHKCPHCGRFSRLSLTAIYFLSLILTSMVAVGIGAAFFYPRSGLIGVGVGGFCVGLILVLPLDRLYGTVLRRLEPLPLDRGSVLLPDRAVRNRRLLWVYIFWYVVFSSGLVAIAVVVGSLVLLFALLFFFTQGAGAVMLAEYLSESPEALVVGGAIIWALCVPAFASWYFGLVHSPLLLDLLASLSATVVEPEELLPVRSALAEAVIAAGAVMPHLALIRDDSVNAFVIARSPDQAWVGVTTGLLDRLDHDELRAVFAHLVARIHDGSALTNTVIASLFQAIARLGSGSEAAVARSGLPLLLGLAYWFMRGCLGIASFVVLLGYRRAHAFTAQAADMGAMLLTKDPEGMLGALEKTLAADTRPAMASHSPLRRDAFKALFFAWPSANRRDPRELIRIQRMQEVLGPAGGYAGEGM